MVDTYILQFVSDTVHVMYRLCILPCIVLFLGGGGKDFVHLVTWSLLLHCVYLQCLNVVTLKTRLWSFPPPSLIKCLEIGRWSVLMHLEYVHTCAHTHTCPVEKLLLHGHGCPKKGQQVSWYLDSSVALDFWYTSMDC